MINKTHASRTVKRLVSYGIVTQRGNSLGINKDYSAWKVTKIGNSRKLPKEVIGVTQRGNKKLPKEALQKKERNYTKERGGKVCITTLTPCQDICLWEIGMKTDTHINSVRQVAETLQSKLMNEPKLQKKYTSFHLTLIEWVKNALTWRQIPYMSEVDRLDMEHEHPDKVAERKLLHAQAMQKGAL